MNNTNTKVAIMIAGKFEPGTDACNEEIKRKIVAILVKMERLFCETTFKEQISIPEVQTIALAGVDFMLFFNH